MHPKTSPLMLRYKKKGEACESEKDAQKVPKWPTNARKAKEENERIQYDKSKA